MPSSRRGEALLIAQTRTCRGAAPPSCVSKMAEFHSDKFRFIKIQAGLFQNLIPLAIILIEEIYTQG